MAEKVPACDMLGSKSEFNALICLENLEEHIIDNYIGLVVAYAGWFVVFMYAKLETDEFRIKMH